MVTASREASGIPVIDITHVDARTGDELLHAIELWGFVFIRGKGTGFTSETIENIFRVVRPGSHHPEERNPERAGPNPLNTVTDFLPLVP